MLQQFMEDLFENPFVLKKDTATGWEDLATHIAVLSSSHTDSTEEGVKILISEVLP